MTHPNDCPSPPPSRLPSAPASRAGASLPSPPGDAGLVLPPLLWAGDLDRAPAPLPWLWHGYLAAGQVTLLTSQWKSGKTTLLAVLLNRMKAGGLVADRVVAAGKGLVVCEESQSHWDQRRRKLAFGDHVAWLFRPFRERPTREQWLSLVDYVAELQARHDLRLVAFDPLAYFLPSGTENHAGRMLDALLPLQRLTARNLAVFLLHHPNKGDILTGQAARGSGALPGYVDINVEMNWYTTADPGDRRRRLRSYSRFEETPLQEVIELNPEGTDYCSHGDLPAEDFGQNWQPLQAVLLEAPRPLTRNDILVRWPQDVPAPQSKTLWRWLARAVAQGLVYQSGTGRRNDPYLYRLPGKEAV